MIDTIETIGKDSVIQHGKHNDRVYLMKLAPLDVHLVIAELMTLALNNGYSKIFCKVPKNLAPLFFANGYLMEAQIPRFYNDELDVFFVSKFLNSDRLLNIENDQLLILSDLLSIEKDQTNKTIPEPPQFEIRLLNKSNIEQITSIYRKVFKSYPFPIFNADYILKTMKEDVQYYGIEKAGKLIALSSAEIDFKTRNAEMTDFATHPNHSGNNLSSLLLQEMEIQMKKQNINTLYTIARLNSVAMNKTFLKNNYHYSGTLIKNTNIAGNIESMNIYYKHL